MPDSRRTMDDFDEIWRQMERAFGPTPRGKRHPVVFSRPVWQPNIDICETAEAVLVLVELAGVQREDINVAVDGLVLSVSGVRRDALHGRKERVYVMEINFGHFERLMPLPAPVDAESARAGYADGFLEIYLPKIPEPKGRKILIIAT